MSNPMTPEELLYALRRWDVKHRQIPGWRKRGRDRQTGLFFGPVYGGVVHHTGSDGPDDNNRALIIKGRADLPGPLAQFGGNDDGVVDIISINRCNHAGGGDPRVLQAVKAESYRVRPPKPRMHQGSPGAFDGNDVYYGIENYYSGKKMTKELYESNIRLWAAICEHHGWGHKSIIGHREWSDWKVDPGNIDMVKYRADIRYLLRNGPEFKVRISQLDGVLI